MVEVSSTIQCKRRNSSGKGEARKFRAAGFAPAVAYGPSSEPRLLVVDPDAFNLQRRQYGMSYIYDVAVEGESGFKALVKSVQEDPVSRELLHVDFYAVDMNRPIRVQVPVELLGKPAGAVDGGLLQQVLRRVEVACLPDRVPTKLTVDVSALNIGGVLHTTALELPEGVTLTSRQKEAVATVVAPAEEEVAVAPELEGELPEGEAPAEGEAAVPADGETPPDSSKEAAE